MFYKQGPLRRWICTSFDTQRWSGGSYIRSQSWFRTAGVKWTASHVCFVGNRCSSARHSPKPTAVRGSPKPRAHSSPSPSKAPGPACTSRAPSRAGSSMAHSSSARSSRAPPSARSSSALSVFITPHLFQFFLVWFPNVLKPCVSLSPTSGIVCLTPVIHVPCVRFNKSDYRMFSSSPRSLLPALDDN